MTRAANAIVDAGGGLVQTSEGNVYKHRVDIRLPMMIYDPRTERMNLCNVRARVTVEL